MKKPFRSGRVFLCLSNAYGLSMPFKLLILFILTISLSPTPETVPKLKDRKVKLKILNAIH